VAEAFARMEKAATHLVHPEHRTLACSCRLLVILFTRTAIGEADFAKWGWRISPFLVSCLPLGISFLAPCFADFPFRCSVFPEDEDEGRAPRPR